MLDQRPLDPPAGARAPASRTSTGCGRGLAESLETSEIHLDVLTNLKRISSHVTALVYPIVEQ